MGGVFAPIFMTDVLGFAGIADVLPEEFKFDWGSFLGGSVGGGVAVGLFLLQRGIDRRENEKRRLSSWFLPSSNN
jgi:hypothetical protein